MTREEKIRKETEEKIALSHAKRSKQLREFKRKFLICVGLASLGLGIAGGVKAANYYDQTHVTISEIEDDILTHSGHNYDPDGTRIDPNLEHKCPVKEYDGRFYEERLAETMEEAGFQDETIEAAQEKFALYYTDNVDEAKKINLKQIENEAKEKHKTR